MLVMWPPLIHCPAPMPTCRATQAWPAAGSTIRWRLRLASPLRHAAASHWNGREQLYAIGFPHPADRIR